MEEQDVNPPTSVTPIITLKIFRKVLMSLWCLIITPGSNFFTHVFTV
ncbi:hypothetical protein CORMATOL_00918 [Corynebacterium matruchotii ATCC 33806]|uniref:Uncharacterized protein n=1 Tax=Corynebacterium matruchotii ATCC 33806 TaxID=566549 RepID=C0E1R5_9CORY|nr:hypothetical protein CORMATOL_00918 [Corynebacterium matruchotii ATCC 33806]